MIDLPDAPWIRETELHGMPEADDINCPVCGAENPEFFYLDGFDVIGCNDCVKRCDPFSWVAEQKRCSA